MFICLQMFDCISALACVPVILMMQKLISNWLALGFKRFLLAVATFCLGSGSQGILCFIGAY